MKMLTVYAVVWNGRVESLHREKQRACYQATALAGSVIYPWEIPAETFEFEGGEE